MRQDHSKKTTKSGMSFVLYGDQWQAIEMLSMEERGMLFTALFEDVLGKDYETISANLPGEVKMALRFLKIQIDVDKKKYEEQKRLHRERQKRYRDRHETSRDVLPIIDVDDDVDVEDDVDVDVDVDDDVDDISSQAANKPIEEKKAAADAKAAWQQSFIQSYNDIVKNCNIPPLQVLTEDRYRQIIQIFQKYGGTKVKKVLCMAAASDFLNGRGVKNRFQATFEWLFEEKNFVKVLEGYYH